MKIALWIAASVLAGITTPVLAAEVIVPAAAGNAQGPAPLRYFGTGGSRVQQIYASSFFGGTQSISSVSFRAYPGASPNGFIGNTVSVSDILIQAGTSAASGNDTAGQPSAQFASNISNAQTVYSGALTLTTAATGSGNQPFDYTINFATPFNYDPSAGSLILDFLIPTDASVSGNGFGFLTFDTVNTTDDGLFSVVDISNGGSTSGTLSTAAAITKFGTTNVAAAVPEPATWATMLFGFFVVGATVRRSRRVRLLAQA